MAEAPPTSEVTSPTDVDLATAFSALVNAEQATSLEARLTAIVDGVQRLGYAAAAIVLVSASGAAEFVIAADTAPGDVDDLVARAKTASLDAAFDEEAPVLSFPLAAPAGRPLARLVVARGDDGYPAARSPLLRLLAARALRAIDDARLVEVAERRAARLQRLQEVGGMLARSLDQNEILRELARQVQRVLPCQGVIVAHPDIERGVVTIALHIDGGTERERGTETLGPGILHDVASSGQSVRIGRVGAAAASVASVADLVGGVAASVGSVLAAPMLVGTQLVGVVAIYGSARTAFNSEDEELLGTIASQAASAIVNARLYDESQRERRQSEALSEIARAVGESLRVPEVFRLIQRHAMALLRAQGATVMIRKGEYLHVVAAIGSGDLLAGMYLPLNGSLAGRAVRTSQCVISNDTARDPDTYQPTRDLAVIRRTVIAPLITERGAIGAIAALDRDGDFGPEDARVLQRLADHVAVAVVNARLYEELADATRELAVTFDAIAGGLVVVDDDGRMLRCNSRAVDLLGAPNEAAIYLRQFVEALVGDTGDAWPVARTLNDRTAHAATVRNPENGRVFTLVVSPHPSGGAVIFFDDVTSVRALEDRYRDLMESASDAIYTLDRQATITAANVATSVLLGKPREQLIGRSMIPFIDPEELEALRVHFHAARTGEARRYECQLVRADGTKRLLSVSNTPIREGGEIVGILGIARDVTDERAAGAALERAESRYARLVESASDSIFTVDEEGVFTSVNRALEAAVGRVRDDLVGFHFIEIFDERDRGTVWEMFAGTLGGESLRREVRLDSASGTSVTVSIATAPIMEGERVVGVLAILRDVNWLAK